MSGVEAILGLAASSAGLAGLAIQLFECAQKLSDFCHTFRDAPKTISKLTTSCQIMSSLLQELESYCQGGASDELLLIQCLMTACRQNVADIQTTFHKIEHSASGFGRLHKVGDFKKMLYTTFQEPDLNKLLAELDRARDWLEFAFKLYHAKQLRADVARIPQLVQEQLCLSIAQLSADINARAETQLAQVKNDMESMRSALRQAEQQGLARQRSLITESGHCNTINAKDITRRTLIRQQQHAHLRLHWSWLSSKVLDVFVSAGPSKWGVQILLCRRVQPDAQVFRCCDQGDVAGIARLIASGEASFQDYCVRVSHGSPDYHMPETLLERAFRCDNIDVLRFLLNNDNSPDQAVRITELFDTRQMFAPFEPDRATKSEQLYRLLLEEYQLDVDFEEHSGINSSQRSCWASWWTCCPTASCRDLVLRSQSISWSRRTVQQRFDLALVLSSNAAQTPNDLLRLVGIHADDTSLPSLRHCSGVSALCCVSHRIWPPLGVVDEPKKRAFQAWTELAITILRQSREPHDFFDARFGHVDYVGTALFSSVTRLAWWPDIHVDASLRMLEVWIVTIKAAGYNVHDFGAVENLLLPEVAKFTTESIHFSTPSCHRRITKLVFHDDPGKCDIHFNDHVKVDMYHLDRMPGAFEDEALSPTICWPPDREMSEGCWVRGRSIAMTSSMQSARTWCERQDWEPQIVLMDQTQDDAGIVWRSLHHPFIPITAKRSSSAPPLQCYRKRTSQSLQYDFYRRQRSWLPSWRLCPWAACCSDQCRTSRRYGGSRHCLPPVSLQSSSVHASAEWSRNSFLSLVAACQRGDFIAMFADTLGHTGRPECPQGCGNIKLGRAQELQASLLQLEGC